MTLRLKTALVGSAILTIATLSTPAFAGDWDYEYLNRKAGTLNETIHVSTSDNTAVAFICNGTHLRASVATENNAGDDVLDRWAKDRTRMTKNVTLNVDGEDVDSSSWRISRKYNIFTTLKRPVTVELYKAAMTGGTATLQRDGKDKITLNFPEPGDVFWDFGRDCGAGRNADRS